MKRVALLAVSLGVSSLAWAGGFEFPANDTEALSRGGAFVAKADDPMALDYNIAGLARQRGTRLILGANFQFGSYEFQRAGNYPGDATDPKTPYAGQPFPLVTNNGGVFSAPLFALSSDFGYFERWTFAIGAYGPSSIGNHDYALTVGGLPSPARYDLVSANLLIVFPTLAAAVRVTRWWEIGLALHLVPSSFDLQNASVAPLGNIKCPYLEYQPCDVPTRIQTSGFTATAALGMMFHPRRDLDLGFNLRAPIEVATTGDVSSPEVNLGAVDPATHQEALKGSVQFTSHIPWVLKLGLRYRFLAADKFEVGDVELDGVYEAWENAEGQGDTLHIDSLGPLVQDITVHIPHNYRDTFGARLGGAFNLRLPRGVLTFRVGGFFDSAATRYKDTRLDFDTMAKWAGTIGLAYRIRGIAISVGYAYIWEPDRNVQNGALQPINGIDGTSTVSGAQLPVVNNGRFSAHTQTLSLSLSINWDEALKKKRTLHYDVD